MNETLQTIKARRSVRAYTEQQVSAEDLNLVFRSVEQPKITRNIQA